VRRLLSTIRLDVTVQARSKLYAIGIGLAVLFGLMVRFLIGREFLALALPAVFLFGVGGTTYVFVAGMVLFEKTEHTLDAQLVTPLRVPEYLASKLLTLTLFSLLECAVIAAIAWWGSEGVRIVPLVAGILAMGAFFTLCGLIQVVRHGSVTRFLMPGAFLWGLIVPLPLLDHFGIWPSPLWYLWPTQAHLLLLTAGFEHVPGWQLAYAALYSAATVALAYLWSRRAFDRFVVQRVRG
jgi:fluoroquinolone transport system permease protein